MKRILLILLAVAAAVLLLIQLVPVERDNPPVEETVAAPAEVMTVLRRSCFDCHSHESRWPWYSYVAPVSFLVADDVHHGREHLNFSTWNRYSADDEADLFEEIGEEVGKGAMPLPIYLRAHPGARLSAAERELILDWAAAGEGEAEGGEEAAERDEEAAEEDEDHDHDHDHGQGRGRGRGSDSENDPN